MTRFTPVKWDRQSKTWRLTDKNNGRLLSFFSEEAANKYVLDPAANPRLPLSRSMSQQRRIYRMTNIAFQQGYKAFCLKGITAENPYWFMGQHNQRVAWQNGFNQARVDQRK